MRWNDIPADAQDALVRWLNVDEPSAADKRRLAKLYEEKRFWFWNCLLCGDKCVHADPEDSEWKHFQEAYDDLDMSYFGDRETYTEAALLSMCNACRYSGCKQIPEGSPAWDKVDDLASRQD